MKETTQTKEINKDSNLKIPEHIAIIMDGNRRWAKNKNIPTTLGHREGVQALKKISRVCNDLGVKYLTVYAFSTENWNRTKDEVDFLMLLIKEVLKSELEELHKENVKLNFIGFHEDLPSDLPNTVKEAIEKTKNNTGLKLQIALNYGSRAEILNAVKLISSEVKNGNISVNSIDENLFEKYLFTKELPSPELLIRTGGEFRISNYLLWQCAYSEFYATKTLWPDFNEEELKKAIKEYNNRQRRFGV